MAILLGLASAITYGAADFVGGLVSKRVNVLVVVALSQTFGTVLLVAALPFFEGEATGTAFGWGAAAGVAGTTGVVMLYRGLAKGRMSVVAPLTAVEAAVVPVVFGLVTGERPSATALAGSLIALLAIALVSTAPSPGGTERQGMRSPGVLDALGAGLAFGAFFVFLDGTGDDAGMWPLVGARGASFMLAVVALAATRRRPVPPPGTALPIAGAGVLDVTANLLYLLATQRGLLSIVAVLTSLYPASTVLLARIFLKERLVRAQLVGIACAFAGIVLIAL